MLLIIFTYVLAQEFLVRNSDAVAREGDDSEHSSDLGQEETEKGLQRCSCVM